MPDQCKRWHDYADTIRPMLRVGALGSGRFRPEWDAALDAVDEWKAAGERDRRQIERLTEALERINRLRPENQPSRLSPAARIAQCFALAQKLAAAAVLAGEEDARVPDNGIRNTAAGEEDTGNG